MPLNWLKSRLSSENRVLAPGDTQDDQFSLHVLFDATKEVRVPLREQSDPGSDVCYEEVEYVCSLCTV